MPITLRPTKIKGSFYLLLPKTIAELIGVEDDSKIFLSVKKVSKRYRLEYSIIYRSNR